MVDAKCSYPNGKHKRRECASTSEAVHEDESLLRKTLRTSCGGFREATKAYENGTDEVRRLLTQECSLIYECNVCRNMFRSLANFISHKRHYCKSITAYNFHSYQDTSSSMLIQTVDRSEPLLVKSRSTGSSPIPNIKSTNRDLSKVIERLKRVEVSSSRSEQKTEVVDKRTDFSSPEPKAPDPVLELERVSTTTHAVYQTLKTKSNDDSIKTELDEVHKLLENEDILLGPDGKALTSPALISDTKSNVKSDNRFDDNNCISKQITPFISCEICKMSFQTEKTLKMHVHRNHTSTTYVFQCPTCAMTFLQPAAVIRHLANEHKKPLRRIRKMRDTILKKKIQIGDVQVKGLCREVKGLQMTDTKDIRDTKIVNTQYNRSIASCSYCLKNFERRAALATHLINCVERKSSLKCNDLSMKVNGPKYQNNEPKSQVSKQFLELDSPNGMTYNQNEEGTEIELNIKQEPQEDPNSTSDSSNINKLFENLEKQTFGNGLRTVCLENLQMMVEFKETSSEEQEEEILANEINNERDDCCNKSNKKKNTKKCLVKRDKSIKKEKAKRFRIVAASKQLTCRCKICSKQFNALSNLRRHISMFHYRSKRFGCNLCDYRAFRRYDIVNHLTFVHKMTGERESMAVEYVTVHEIKYSKDDVESDIVVINDGANASEHQRNEHDERLIEPKSFLPKTYEKKKKSKKVILQPNKDSVVSIKIDSIELKDKSHVKVVRRKLKRSFETQVEGKSRPIRNRIKTVNNDFVYDLLTMKEEPKQASRLGLKRGNADCVDRDDFGNVELVPPPIKITPYRLRTEPLIPADKNSVKGFSANLCRNVVNKGLAASSTLPELPTERPQMRSRLISSSRSDSNTIRIIETSELEAAGLKSTFFDDSFLEKFAKKSNPSFKMKPLLALQHSPLKSILQKFDASQQNNVKMINIPLPKQSSSLLKSLPQTNRKEKDSTPNGKQILEPSSPPATPKKRITLMERLAENRAKRRNSHIRNALET